jgi:hypothetical protein
MLVTAKLERAGRTLGDGVALGSEYSVSPQHQSLAGTKLVVVAGPHKDFPSCPDVYSVKLTAPTTLSSDLPYFNLEGGWEYVTISVS